jgi:hypothetical protein
MKEVKRRRKRNTVSDDEGSLNSYQLHQDEGEKFGANGDLSGGWGKGNRGGEGDHV